MAQRQKNETFFYTFLNIDDHILLTIVNSNKYLFLYYKDLPDIKFFNNKN